MAVAFMIKAASGKKILRGQDHFWSVIRTLGDGGQTFSVADVDGQCNATDRATVRDYVRRLVAGGVAEIAETGETANLYRLLKRPVTTPTFDRDGNPIARADGQTQMWNAIRAAEAFNAREIAVTASTDTCEVKETAAKSYIKWLFKAGYLLIVQQSKPGTQAVYRLKPSMNTGPLPPLVMRTKAVFDQNRDKMMGDVVAEEDRP